MKDISELQTHIGAYGKTREVYTQYRKLTAVVAASNAPVYTGARLLVASAPKPP